MYAAKALSAATRRTLPIGTAVSMASCESLADATLCTEQSFLCAAGPQDQENQLLNFEGMELISIHIIYELRNQCPVQFLRLS